MMHEGAMWIFPYSREIHIEILREITSGGNETTGQLNHQSRAKLLQSLFIHLFAVCDVILQGVVK